MATAWGAEAGRPASISLPAELIAYDQPRVAWMLENADPASPDLGSLVGPSDWFPYGVLDTGANGVMLGAQAYGEFNWNTFEFDYNYDRYELASRPGTTPVQHPRYTEIGVAGSEDVDLLAPYNVHVFGRTQVNAGTEVSPALSVYNATAMGATGNDRQTPADFGSFSAIVGMPAMRGQVVEMDLRPLSSDNLELMFAEYLPKMPAATANSYHVPLTPLPVEYNKPQQPGDPQPTFAPVPLVEVVAKTQAVSQTTSQSSSRKMLLDTGAQTSMISTALAADLKLNLDPTDPDTDIIDLNGDGKIDPADDYIEVGGLGGSTSIPLVRIDQIALPTAEGTELRLTDLVAGVLDVADLGGVLGMNILTSGYGDLLFSGTGEYGDFTEVYLDFTNWDAGSGTLRLEVNAALNPEPGGLLVLTWAGAGLLLRRARQ